MEAGNNAPNGGQPTLPLKKPPGYREPTDSSPVKPPPNIRKPGPPLPQSYQPVKPRGKRRSACRICCCCCCVGIIVLIIVIVIIFGVLFVWFDPKPPTFHLESFNITSLTVAKRPDGSYLSAATTARVEAKNPNSRLKYRYGRSDVTVTAGGDGGDGVRLGKTSLPGFNQGEKNVTVLRVAMKVKDQMVDDSAGERLASRFKSRTLAVNVEVKTSVGVELWSLRIGKLGVTVKCRSVGGGGSQMPKCTINTLRWVNIH